MIFKKITEYTKNELLERSIFRNLNDGLASLPIKDNQIVVAQVGNGKIICLTKTNLAQGTCDCCLDYSVHDALQGLKRVTIYEVVVEG